MTWRRHTQANDVREKLVKFKPRPSFSASAPMAAAAVAEPLVWIRWILAKDGAVDHEWMPARFWPMQGRVRVTFDDGTQADAAVDPSSLKRATIVAAEMLSDVRVLSESTALESAFFSRVNP